MRRDFKNLITPCLNPNALHQWVKTFCDIDVPRVAIVPGHSAPFDYLIHTYFEPATDVVGWAPRGGGKTRLAAIATLLDLLHKPGCQVRILGGSLEQSMKMWEHLHPSLLHMVGEHLDTQSRNARRVTLPTGSSAAVLTQSERAVRGLRVQKLRCDEVELFKPHIWEAAQLVTKSLRKKGNQGCVGRSWFAVDESDEREGADGGEVEGRLVPMNVNSDLDASKAHGASSVGFTSQKSVSKDGEQGTSSPDTVPLSKSTDDGPLTTDAPPATDIAPPLPIAPSPINGVIEAISTLHAPYGLMNQVVEQAMERKTKLIKWSLMEVLERCPRERECESCPLWEECRGVAKERCGGYFPIDDAVRMKQRVGKDVWEAEMLCRKPNVSDCVFPAFDEAKHVSIDIEPAGQITLAIDFGYVNPFVCLWIADDGVNVTVFDEYVQPQRTMDEHIGVIRARGWGRVSRIACDPAGRTRSDQTSVSNVRLLRNAGFSVHAKGSQIIDGLERIRAALESATGVVTLRIHPRCEQLIRAMRQYHYADGGSELPVKDGENDHHIDALRYFFINRQSAKVASRHY